MTLFLIVGGILVIFGLMLVVSPRVFSRIEQQADRVYAIDHIILKHRIVFGTLFLFSAAYMIYIYFKL